MRDVEEEREGRLIADVLPGARPGGRAPRDAPRARCPRAASAWAGAPSTPPSRARRRRGTSRSPCWTWTARSTRWPASAAPAPRRDAPGPCAACSSARARTSAGSWPRWCWARSGRGRWTASCRRRSRGRPDSLRGTSARPPCSRPASARWHAQPWRRARAVSRASRCASCRRSRPCPPARRRTRRRRPSAWARPPSSTSPTARASSSTKPGTKCASSPASCGTRLRACRSSRSWRVLWSRASCWRWARPSRLPHGRRIRSR